MATVEAQELAAAGTDGLTWTAAASGGDEVPTGRGLVLLIRNTDTAAHTVTITTPVTVRGVAVDDVTRSVAADGVAAVPMVDELYRDPASRRAALSYDAATGIELAVLRLPR
ncbi:hypothetical protein SAMN04487819_11668 [Actinopolyspora alba]|uniref:Uncharacterized protein n=1 Tax=Actinopolyspora alba TaxID=673379 RepID=A0A1I2BEP6_9ACTN|nr:hypothetical protein [Actinopolyspora alba]SFE54672.1 hypothetical protein SAMN04487819_11668 [Actinopolyspora alba]